MNSTAKGAVSGVLFLLGAVLHGQEIKFGEPQELDPSKFAERTVWIPYWTEKDGHHALLHLRNALHHYPLTASVEVLSQTGAVLASIPVDLPKASNLDLALQSLLPSGLHEDNRSGSIRITYSYQYDGALQAELSIRDSTRNHAYTIVGRKAFAGSQNLAYLAVHRPTPQTYVELAFTNPLADREVAIQIRLRRGSRWENLNRLSLKPLHTEKLRILADRLNDGEAGVSLLQAEYSVSTSEVIANAWLEDEATGFSNTALFHDHYPRSNTLYATQLIAGALPDQVLDRGPRFDGSLVFVNFGQEPSTLEGTLHCMINGSAVPVPLPAMPLEPLSPRRIALSSLLAGTLNGAAGAMCSGQFTFTGPPGHVTGRYYAASESKVYGAYVKLEPFVGRAYSEVYWTTEEDFVPILTVTNFSRETDEIEIYISRRERFALLHSEPLAPGASLTVNVRDLLQRLRTEGKFTDEYGGTYIRTRKPSGKLMVKQHSISQRRLMMAPYYGGYDHVYAHWFSWPLPPSQLNVGDQSEAGATTCYYYAGCFHGIFPVVSSNPYVVHVTNFPPSWGSASVLQALSPGSVELSSSACCDESEMEVQALELEVQVKPTVIFTAGDPKIPLSNDTRATSSIQWTAEGYPSGGTYSWSTPSHRIALSGQGTATVTVTSAAASGQQNDVALSVTYTINGQTATLPTSLTVVKPASLEASPQPSGSHACSEPVGCTSYQNLRRYTMKDQFGNVFGPWPSIAIREEFTGHKSTCSGVSSPPTPTDNIGSYFSFFDDEFWLCTNSCPYCLSGAGGCSAEANQKWFVNGFQVGSYKVTWTCNGANVTP